MRKTLLSVFLIFLLLYGISPESSAQMKGAVSSKMYSTWIWDTSKIVTESDEIFAFFKQKKVNILYLQVNRDIPFSNYQSFIEQAKKKGIKVYAMDGSPEWLDPKNKRHVHFLNWVSDYQKKSKKNERFSGLHLDVEPYLYKGWENNYQSTVKRYQDIIKKAKKEAASLALPLEMDIPFWFSESNFTNKTYGKGVLSEWVIKNVDGVTIMAYRNFIKGQNGILALTLDEIKYANKAGKKVQIALETTKPDSEPPYLSFFEKGQKELQKTINSLHNSYKEHKSFNGFAIHSYESWSKLKP